MAENITKALNRFDRVLGGLNGAPSVLHTKPTTIMVVTPIAGDAQTFIIQTFRRKDEGDGSSESFVFLQHVDEDKTTRIVIPPKVIDCIVRQYDVLARRAASKSRKESIAERMANGWKPSFKKRKNA